MCSDCYRPLITLISSFNKQHKSHKKESSTRIKKWRDFVDFFIESFIKRKNKQKFKPNIHWSTDTLRITARAHGRQESEATQEINVAS